MKSSKLKAGALLLASALIMQGCGEAPVTLTEQEEAVIVNYSAHVVAKYNRRQPDGLCYVSPEKLQEEEQETETETESETAEDTQGGSSKTSGEKHSSDAAAETKSMAEALGLSGVSVNYNGSEYKDSYVQPGTYALDATAGKKFLVLNFTITNTGDSDAAIDVLDKQPTILLQMGDSTKVTAKTTILLNDLSTYQDTIPAGGSSDVVLLFEVPEDNGETGQLQLEVQADGSDAVVNL